MIEITEEQAPTLIRTESRGEEGSRASMVKSVNEMRLTPVDEGTEVSYSADVEISGRLGRYGAGMMKKIATKLAGKFEDPSGPSPRRRKRSRGSRMMAATFHKPATVDDAVRVLSDAGEGGRPISGGATLVAMMNAKLVEPDVLVSLSAIAELKDFGRAPDGTVRIGAMRRHRETAFESDLSGGQAVVAKAASQIANPPVRNMGTIGGSISFADPAADYPPALVAADATIEIAGPAGRRLVPGRGVLSGLVRDRGGAGRDRDGGSAAARAGAGRRPL